MAQQDPGAEHVDVLVVDDDSDYADTVSAYLRRHDLQAVQATCGADAVAVARRTRPSLVLLDIGLPDMDGMEVIVRLEEDGQRPGVILLSGCVEWLQLAAMSNLRIRGSFAKPARLSMMLAQINDYLRECVTPLAPAAG